MTDELTAFYEALLFIAERPLEHGGDRRARRVPRVQAEAGLAALAEELADDQRGLRVQRMDDAWQLVTAPEVGARLAAYAAREEARLSPAALEALAVVAYRQPCTRGEIDRVRGVDSDYVVRSLPASAADRGGRPTRHAGTSDAVRHDLHLPGALRADLAR